jgi:hypothetical protein
VEVETLFGKVLTREFHTSLQRSNSILLKDNPNLKPLFLWLKNLNIKSIEDVKFEKLKEKLEKIKFERELKFHIDWDVPMIVLHNIIPLEGNFNEGVPEFINTFYKAMYSPEGFL